MFKRFGAQSEIFLWNISRYCSLREEKRLFCSFDVCYFVVFMCDSIRSNLIDIDSRRTCGVRYRFYYHVEIKKGDHIKCE